MAGSGSQPVDPRGPSLSGRSVAAVATTIRTVISTTMVVMIVIVVGNGVADQSCGGSPSYGDGGINGLHRTASGIVGGHAADAESGKADQGGPTEKRGMCLHVIINVAPGALFNRFSEIFSAITTMAAAGLPAWAGEAHEEDREREHHDAGGDEGLPFHDLRSREVSHLGKPPARQHRRRRS